MIQFQVTVIDATTNAAIIAYGYERFDIAAIIFFILITGIAVDFYLNSYYH